MAHHGQTLPVEDPGTLEQNSGSLANTAMYAGAIGLLFAGLVAFFTGDWTRFKFSYLQNLCFVLTIPLGALFFVLIQHITRAGWSTVVRRIAEMMTSGFVPAAILFLPIIVLLFSGDSALFLWNDPEVASTDPLIKHKQIYLNATWFTVRAVAYFAFWILCARYYLKTSAAQDESGDPKLSLRMEKFSAVSLILFALSITFAAVDWIMSLDPHWFSTIIGVYYFAASAVSFYATLAIIVHLANRNGLLTQSITVEHRHDIGKLLFGFNCFWAYIAFSQYLLYWYANIPEETMWFMRRQENGWEIVSMILILGHFVIPFLGLMSRTVKRNPTKLFCWAIFMLIMSWVDIYWLMIPEVSPGTPAPGLIDLGCLLGVGGIVTFGAIKLSEQYSLLPVKDPRLQESLSFHNI